jgi:hypothetical protein
MNKFFLSTGVLAVVLTAAFYAFNAYIYTEKQGDGLSMEPYRGTLSGEYVCLPHTDTTGPQTKECALGIKTEVGEYYAVDFSAMSQTNPGLETGDFFKANGLITPIERLSTDHWKKYPIEGIFSVTDSVEKIDR